MIEEYRKEIATLNDELAKARSQAMMRLNRIQSTTDYLHELIDMVRTPEEKRLLGAVRDSLEL